MSSSNLFEEEYDQKNPFIMQNKENQTRKP